MLFHSVDHGEKCEITAKPKKCISTNTHDTHTLSHTHVVIAVVLRMSLFLCLGTCLFTLDPNTANTELILSEENKNVTGVRKKQPYPDHPDRFDHWYQVLCRESVCGRCYWEIEWSGDVRISVSYKNISRKGPGKECEFGSNDQSWSLDCFPYSYSFRHNNIVTELLVESISSRVGVYVDHSAGTLSFYNVETMKLIHTVQTTFTQPLYPGFGFNYYGSVKLKND
ncbi:stonustoxin subunit beta-like isoform X2 [Puntigrus tetrazona]|uniref:stonustoxin subunit beta-like isoform X2 n=1 Tax=Puntigrus tetrazona TaxID=1606681 RepID=UPI001C89508F|nr:stonustoxin subunit beta-like isoform X2 [Puntigrus tetrazona]XP_043093393.1 stonustoxin subunit beta-like isoform X2 [Puntigrus tetrazona]